MTDHLLNPMSTEELQAELAAQRIIDGYPPIGTIEVATDGRRWSVRVWRPWINIGPKSNYAEHLESRTFTARSRKRALRRARRWDEKQTPGPPVAWEVIEGYDDGDQGT